MKLSLYKFNKISDCTKFFIASLYINISELINIVYLSKRIENISRINKELLLFFKSSSHMDKICAKYFSSFCAKVNSLLSIGLFFISFSSFKFNFNTH